jgi:hypothetical protein
MDFDPDLIDGVGIRRRQGRQGLRDQDGPAGGEARAVTTKVGVVLILILGGIALMAFVAVGVAWWWA